MKKLYALLTLQCIASLVFAEQYQDIIVDGKIVSSGNRECAQRYEGLKPLLNKFKRKFTVLDIGASEGFFSLNIAYNYNATCVMIEGDYAKRGPTADRLLEICKQNDKLDNLIYLKKHITVEELEKIAACEHFDIVLGLNVVHHFRKDWKRALDAIFGIADYVVVEIPPTTDAVFANNKEVRACEEYLNQKGGTVIAQTPRHTDPSAISSMRLYEVKKPTITHKHWFFGTSAKQEGTSYKINSTFEKKTFVKEKGDTIVARPWYSGINLMTFKILNGVWPDKLHLSKEIMNYRTKLHADLYPWNIIIQGKKVRAIDNDGEYTNDPFLCLLHSVRFSMLDTPKEAHDYVFNELFRRNPRSIMDIALPEEMKLSYCLRSVKTDVSYGELIDKITILEIKQRKTTNPDKLKNVEKELTILTEIMNEHIPMNEEIMHLKQELRRVNETLWNIEDSIRIKERDQQFDETFIQLARAVYINNDERAVLKRKINDLLGSALIEEKIYENYKKHGLL